MEWAGEGERGGGKGGEDRETGAIRGGGKGVVARQSCMSSIECESRAIRIKDSQGLT